jgi:hypothetical protein
MRGRNSAASLSAAAVLASLWWATAPGTPESEPNAAPSYLSRVLPTKPERATVPVGFDRRHIEVKFVDELDIGVSPTGMPIDRQTRVLNAPAAQSLLADILFAGGRWQRMTGDAELEIDLRLQIAESRLNRDIADLNNYFILTVPEGANAESWLDRLNALPEVEIALAMPLPAPAPLPPNYQGSQGYLGAAPGGIGASGAWLVPGGTGAPTVGGPVVVCDFEYSWNLSHNDLPATITSLVPPGYSPSDPFSDDNHGTAVLGELLSLNNGWGTTGASYGVQGVVAPTFLNSAWQLGVAMAYAMTVLVPGDVFLIEQQIQGPNYPGPGPQDGLVPVEWWASWYYTIVTAAGNGIHVVEAAGNGREDLDAVAYNVGHAPFLPQNNSGAMIVGAGAVPGGSDVDRSRLSFSNWGSRLDLQGWGEKVYSTGYGDLYAIEGQNRWYTRTFGGTSSASPNVASATAILESVYESGSNGLPLPTGMLRSLLKTTGSPQQAGTFPASQNIGPRPNLAAALLSLSLAPDTCEYYKAPWVDYAPNGMPDFDQKQAQWISPITGGWSHCGPAALANCFWWFDSKFEPNPVVPTPFWPGPGNPAPNDGYPLVYSFDAFGRWDDHDTNNVIPLVDSLAGYCKTNSPGRSGTYVYHLSQGATQWLNAVGLAAKYTVRVYPIDPAWGFDSLRAEVLRSQDVILLLGFWQEMAPHMCERIGGHYVTVAGTCPEPFDSALCISDPYFDANEGEPPAGSAHRSGVHNNVANVSGPHGTIHHDRYDVVPSLCQPFAPPFFQCELPSYPVNAANVSIWHKQNAYDTLMVPVTPMGAPIHTILEYAVVICPVECPDQDGDGVCDAADNCPTTYNPNQADVDQDGAGDVCDGCPLDAGKTSPGICGCGVPDTDSDGDLVPDCVDNCPSTYNPNQLDVDQDGFGDICDGCPFDAGKTSPGICGCGVSDMDSDGDLVPDCVDNCPAVANPLQVDVDGDGHGDVCDNCVNVANPDQLITILMTGDLNRSGTYTSSDVILLVNYVFKSGAPPQPCPAAGDCNCSGTVSSADIIVLVNHVFKGGPAPCNVCGGSGLGWSCP